MRKIRFDELMDIFYSKVYPEPNTGCWLWGGAVNICGYGIFKYQVLPFKTKLAHRASYLLHYGDFDYNNLQVLHKCDNPACVNPEHLFLGTHQDNMNDRKIKNRTNRIAHKGSNCGASSLTENDVREIRSMTNINQYEIAKKYGVTQPTISCIIKRKTWRHI